MMSSHNGEVYFRGMTESDWRRLHTRVIPNPLPLDEFKDVVLAGKLQDRYLAKDLHKMMQELRDLLREHGELREAALFPLSGKKQELSEAAAAAVRVIDAHRDRVPALRRSPGSTTTHAPAEHGEGREGSTSPTLDSASDQQRLSNSGSGNGEERPSALLPAALSPTSTTTADNPSTSSRRSSRVLPLVGHISPEEQALAPPSPSVPPVAPPREPAVERSPRQLSALPPRSATSWTMNDRLSSTIAKHAATSAPPQAAATTTTAATVLAPLPTSSTTPSLSSSSSLWAGAAATTTAAAPAVAVAAGAVPGVTVSTGTANELAQLNEAAPPFFRILSVARRFQLRFGSSPLRFEIPVQYTDAVHSRRLRVYLIPLRHPNIPARWPTAKEVVVYVNEQCLLTPWKRSWPERKQEVAKTFLPLDITYLLSRNVPSQRMQVDIFNREYLSPAILAVVQPQTLEEVTESMLLSRAGCRSVAQVLQAFAALPTSPTPPPSLLLSNDAAVWATYASALEEDEEEDGLEADDPVITTKCPISQLPLAVPVRGRHCSHLQCVDLEAFLVSCHKGAYWNCALCDAEMRPKDVQIDTVLWRYLHTFGASDHFPTYLRLSAGSAGSGGGGGGQQGRYFWHPSTRTGEDADVVSDGDRDSNEDDDNGNSEEGRSSGYGDRTARVVGGGPPQHILHTAPTAKATTAPPSPSCGGDGAPCEGEWTAAPERKRGREEGEEDGKRAQGPQGTADDPIEL